MASHFLERTTEGAPHAKVWLDGASHIKEIPKIYFIAPCMPCVSLRLYNHILTNKLRFKAMLKVF